METRAAKRAKANDCDQLNETELFDSFVDACTKGNLDEVKRITATSGFKILERSDSEVGYLDAALGGHVEVMRYLIVHCKVDAEALGQDGWRALLYACSCGHFEAVKFLLDEIGVKSFVRDGTNLQNGLLLACSNGHIDVVKYLVDSGRADIEELIGANDDDAFNALVTASMKNQLAIVKYLVEEKNARIEATNRKNQTALLCAACMGALEVVEYLIDKGANIDVVSAGGITPLLIACRLRRLPVLKVLASRGANVDAVDDIGRRALTNVGLEDDENEDNGFVLPVVKYLIEELHVDIEAKDQPSLWTALSYYVAFDHIATVEYLLYERGADMSVVDSDGMTVFNLASSVEMRALLTAERDSRRDPGIKRAVVEPPDVAEKVEEEQEEEEEKEEGEEEGEQDDGDGEHGEDM